MRTFPLFLLGKKPNAARAGGAGDFSTTATATTAGLLKAQRNSHDDWNISWERMP
jgi:hypothetical protein